MFARRLKNNIIEIVNKESQNELLSFTFIPNLSTEDALALIFAANNVKSVKDGILTITYNKDDNVYKMFKGIVINSAKRDNVVLKELLPESIHMNIDAVPGKSVLIRDPSKQTITIALRKTTGSTQLTINRVYINNPAADIFFRDVKTCQRYKETGKCVLDSRDQALYKKWCDYMDQVYKVLIDIHKTRQ